MIRESGYLREAEISGRLAAHLTATQVELRQQGSGGGPPPAERQQRRDCGGPPGGRGHGQAPLGDAVPLPGLGEHDGAALEIPLLNEAPLLEPLEVKVDR